MTIQGSGQTIDADFKSTAIYVHYADLHLSDLTIRNGYSQTVGGGLFTVGGTQTLDRVQMSGNEGGDGGAIEAFSGIASTHVVLDDCDLYDNYASRGGAIFSQNAGITLTGTFVSGNAAQSVAGAVAVDGGTLDVTDSVLTGNSAPQGGAIATSGVTTITRTIIAANSAASFGGAINLQSGASSTTIVESTISANTAANGGAIGTTSGGAVTLTNSTLANNTASADGGAIYGTKYPHLTFNSATISGNSAGSAGGGIWVGGDGNYGQPVLASANTIISANNASSGKDLAGLGAANLTGNNNLFGAALNTTPFNAAANHNVFTDTPGLGPLQNNGGFTNTFALLAGSAAIDAGSNASAAGLANDQRGSGFARIAQATVDIGAFEYLGDRIFASGFEAVP